MKAARIGTKVRATIFTMAFLSFVGVASAEIRDFTAIDQAVMAMPCAKSVAEVISFIGQNAGDDWERVRGTYGWMTHNIAYDVDALFRGTRTAIDAAGVFASGKSVCQGYSQLFAAIAEGLGLEVKVISGYAKAYSYRPGQHFKSCNHAWNAVKLDGSWHFMESTWGAGFVRDSRFEAKYTSAWFDMNPRLFVLNHFPEDTEWLLFESKMTLRDYEKAPLVETPTVEQLVEAGFDAEEIVSLLPFAPFPKYFGQYARDFKAMGGRSEDLASFLSQGDVPEIYMYPNIQPALVEYPKQAKLAPGRKYKFAVKLPGVEKAAVITGGEFTFLEKDGEVFSGVATVAHGDVRLSARIDHKGSLSYWPLMIWKTQ